LQRDDVTLDGRAALVTGAARGIGRAIAQTFAAFGADLILVDRDEEPLNEAAREAEALGRRALVAVLDVRDPEAVEVMAGSVSAEFPTVHVLVNNAGGTYAAPFIGSTPKGDETLVRENLLSAAWVTRALAPLLADGASVINVTTIEAQRAAPQYALYAAAKAGLESLTRTLALEFGDRGIRVNAIAPDVIPTPGVGAVEGPPRTPLTRLGSVDDVAGAALFLATPLSAFVTGTVVAVDGGNAAAGGWHRSEDGWTS
jgi:3-oxoacyl-[acyl-carrier protein] reductase